MFRNLYISLLTPIIISIFISIFFIPFLFNSLVHYGTSNGSLINSNYSNILFNTTQSLTSQSFIWPTPGYSKITSKFGYRDSPTTGAGTYHGGIDIASPQNSSIISIADGIVKFVGWYGANGYTVIIDHKNGFESTYGHVSPDFLISIGDSVKKGELIAKVGPKYVEKKNYTTYKDSSGKYTNGATTGSHLHFAISKDNIKINPELLFK